jgi:small subunit ribosomal protein S27e
MSITQKSKFIKVRCPKCNNEEIIFSKGSFEVKCLVCGTKLAKPTGGISKIDAKILEILS